MVAITVTDPSHPSHLVAELQAMRKDGELFDFLIKGNNESFHIHSLVLASMSPVFKALLRSALDESDKKEATFPSIPDDILPMVIDFAYNGTCMFSGDELAELVKAAHYLQMSKLLQLCEEHVSSVLQPSNCISWLLLADKLQLTGIMTLSQKMMRTAFLEIIKTEDFNNLEKSELVQYLSDVREHGTHSDVLLEGALQWLKRDTENRAVHMQELFKLVHISKCSEDVLREMITENSALLDKEQGVYKLVLCEVLNKPKSEILGKDKTVLIVGGQSLSNIPNTDCWKLQDGKLIEFCEVSEVPPIKPGHSICEIPGGLMLTGGVDSDLCIQFISMESLWVMQTPLPSTRVDHGSGFISGKVFLISGSVAGRPSPSVDVMDMDDKTWCPGPEMPQHADLTKVVTCNAILYVLLTVEGILYLLDADSTAWTAKSPLPQISYGCSLAASEDRMFAAGGDKNITCMYTPATDTWCCLTGPSLKERQGSLVYHQQKLYLFAGCKIDKDLTDVEEYDVKADKWTFTKWKLPRPVWSHRAFLVGVPT